MPGSADFEVSGRLRARRLRATQPPRTTTTSEHVRIEHRDQRQGHDTELEPDGTYEDIEIEKRLRGEIATD
jgi:hypothetical protein